MIDMIRLIWLIAVFVPEGHVLGNIYPIAGNLLRGNVNEVSFRVASYVFT